MAVIDYIGVVGDDNLPTELFIGFWEDSEDLASIAETPISSDAELAEGIWQGQNEKLEAENDYCDQLQTLFKKKQERIDGVVDKVMDVIEAFIGSWLSNLVATWVGFYTESLTLAGLAGFFTEIGAGWGFDFLRSLLTRGNELLDGIKAENEKLLQIEKSRENYEYREQVLARHREDIKIILEQIRMAEKSIELNTQLEMKALLERLTDLALRDDTIELGNMRLHSKGRVVNF
jgi:hypothetical protein